MGNYRGFIAAADALLAIREEVSSIDKHLESLVLFSNFFPCSPTFCVLIYIYIRLTLFSFLNA